MDSLYTLTDLVAAEASAVAFATARFPNLVRETMYQARVQPILDKLQPEERDSLHLSCGYAHAVGWAVLSQALGIMSGHDQSREMGPRTATPLYAPKANFGGWVRIFRSKAAAYPKAMVDALVDEVWPLVASAEGEERVRGLYGIPAVKPVTRQGLKAAMLASDLFDAPWMACVWRPSHGWAVLGVATDYLDGRLPVEASDARDLFVREHADQTFPAEREEGRGVFVMRDGPVPVTLSRPGPAVGISAAISGIELALRRGYRLDMVYRPVESPIESWEDGINGVAPTPLLGCLVYGPTSSYLVAFQTSGQHVRLEGLDERDYALFHVLTGVDPAMPLSLRDLETLALQGIPVYGRIPSFSARVEGAE